MILSSRWLNIKLPIFQDDFKKWYLQAKMLQIRYSSVVTAVLYWLYTLLEVQQHLPYEQLRIVSHGIVIPLTMLAAALISMHERFYRPMQLLLLIAPACAVAVNIYLDAGLLSYPRFVPETYLTIIWIFAISGLNFIPATVSALICISFEIVLPWYFYGKMIPLFSMHWLWVLSAFAFGIVAALIMEQVYHVIFMQQRALIHLSNVDSLTKLWNHKKITELLLHESERTNRYNSPLSIIMLDIDHFKRVNDTFGHIVGDQVLKHFSKILKSNLRHSDYIGRVGGEEFLIILPQTTLHQAYRIAKELLEVIRQSDFAPAGQQTASLGVSQYQADEPIRSTLERADQALYHVKEHGRDDANIQNCQVS
ncbi:GGDEF domain-containing protein [Celerinatantimonas sp. MCCC 1A17872]|uniref:GGDEF domain-containing protein n=1 Tax=Celerinatantimonas sp. MCCC 1A17872 TaxID=3177514 RepID=UPI0038CB6640